MTNTDVASRKVRAMTRSDVHRVGELVPGDYKFVDILDLYAGGAKDDVAAIVSRTVVPRGWRTFVEEQAKRIAIYERQMLGDRSNMSQCNICGAHIRYAVVWSYRPNGEFAGFITTGTDCAESMGSAQISEISEKAGALREFVAGFRRSVREAEDKASKAPEIPAEAQQRWSDAERARRAWLDQDRLHVRVSKYLYETVTRHVEDGCVGPAGCFYCSLGQDLVERGQLSPRQTNAIARQLSQPFPPAKTHIPSGPGQRVSGRITSQKSGHMLVKCPGFRVWMVPPADFRSVQTGSDIAFTADLTVSERDKTFLLAANVRDGEVLV